MKFVNLVIERKPSYDPYYPHELVGLVQLSGDRGAFLVASAVRLPDRIFPTSFHLNTAFNIIPNPVPKPFRNTT